MTSVRTWLLIAMVGLAPAVALAEEQWSEAQAAAADRPQRGSTMRSVESRYGEPAVRHAAVGQPPITRWDYPGLAVFFEHDRVIHAVLVRAAPSG